MIAHPVFPLEALLADWAGVRLLVRVGQTVTVEVVDVSEGFPTGLTGMVLPHLVGVGTGIGIRVLLHGADNDNSCLNRLRRRSHRYSRLGYGYRDRLDLLVRVLTRLGEGVWGHGGWGRRRKRGWLSGQGELEEGERDGLLLHSCNLCSILLLLGGSVFHLDTRMNRLMPPQVVAVLELLVACGTDVGRPARLGEWFNR